MSPIKHLYTSTVKYRLLGHGTVHRTEHLIGEARHRDGTPTRTEMNESDVLTVLVKTKVCASRRKRKKTPTVVTTKTLTKGKRKK